MDKTNFALSHYDIEKAIDRIKKNLSGDIPQIADFENLVQSNEIGESEGKKSVTAIYVNLEFKLLDKLKEDNLFKAYRTCQREILALFKDNMDFMDFIGFDDAYCGIFNTSFRPQIDQILESVGKINAILEFFQLYFEKKLNVKIEYQIGVDYEEAYVFKEIINISTHTSLNHRYWCGKVFQNTKSLAKLSGEDGQHVYITSRIFNNLKDEYKAFFESFQQDVYYANVVNTKIINWAKSYNYGE